MKICFFDVETTGKDPKTCRITEMGAAVVEPCKSMTAWKLHVLAHIDTPVYEADYPPQVEVLEVTPHLTDEFLKANGKSFVQAVTDLVSMFDDMGWPDFMMAHNSDYDEEVFREEMKRHKTELLGAFDDGILQQLWGIQWACSIKDIPWAEKYRCKQLSHLALDHKVPMDGRDLHKAIADVWLLVDLLQAVQVDWTAIVEQLKVPWVIVRAIIPPPFGKGNDGGKGKDRCKELKMRYAELDNVKLPNAWLKKLKADQVDAFSAELGYPVRIVN
jgi:DNA polymerase III epsilon subunit-like protein